MKRIKKCLVMFPITVLIVLIALLYGVRVMAQHTFCNPLNIDYGCGGIIADEPYREAADPVIVLFKDKYYLFATGDHGGGIACLMTLSIGRVCSSAKRIQALKHLLS